MTASVVDSEIKDIVGTLAHNNERPVLAHRAIGFGSTEASKESIYSAVEEGVTELEFDVRMTHDEVPVLHHDVSLVGTDGTHRKVAEITADEFRSLELSTGEHLLTLEDVFSIIVEARNEVTRLHIDIKDFSPVFIDSILDLIRRYRMEHRVVIVSWMPQALQYAYEQDCSLVYSFSFFPSVRGVSRFIIGILNRLYRHNVPLFGRIATWVSRARSAHRGTASEIISETVLLDAEVHWSTPRDEGRQVAIVGKHHMALSNLGRNFDESKVMMARVINGGYINVLAFEELFDNFCARSDSPKLCRALIAFLDRSRVPALIRLARRLGAIGARISVYDLDKEESLDRHFDSFERKRVQSGPVFTNNPLLIPRLR